MSARRKNNRSGGFTLIEVLLAVSVFAIVLAAINSVFFAALRLRNKAVQTFETALPLQQALAILQKDLEGIMLPGGPLSGTFTTTVQGASNSVPFVGERITPDIYTSSGNVGELARWADVQKVAYFLSIPTNNNATIENGRELFRVITRNLLPVNIEEQEVQFLMGGVEQMRLEYYNGLTWTEVWDGNVTTNLPNAIKVQLTLTEDYQGTTRVPAPVELVVPVLVQASAEGGGEE